MPGAFGEVGDVVVRGRAELEAAFLEMRKDVLVGLKPAVFAAAEPVRQDAEQLNVSNIRNIGPNWSRVRLGASVSRGGALVYMAPQVRRKRGGSRRPNLAPLLAADMEQARDDHQDEFVAALDVLVTASAAKSGLL